MTSIERNVALIRRWLRMADGGFAGDFDEFFVADYAGQVSGRMHMDLTELMRLERGFAAAFTDAVRTIDDLWGAGDKVVLRITARARHSGVFNGIPATGRAIVMTGIVIFRFRDGGIAESWGELDFAGLSGVSSRIRSQGLRSDDRFRRPRSGEALNPGRTARPHGFLDR